MIAIAAVASLAMLPPAQDSPDLLTQTYREPLLNLAFDYPKDWKSRKGRDSIRFTFNIPNSSEQAELEVNRIAFHSSKDLWQTIQKRINEQQRKPIERQWEELVLNVPMLLTQVSASEKGVPTTTLSGLYYTRTIRKMLVKLTAPTSEFPKAKYAFDQVLLTLRTLDGSEPQEDDENVTLDPNPKPIIAPPKRSVLTGNEPSKIDVSRTEIPITVSTKSVIVKVPEGWSAEETEGNRLQLKHADLAGAVRVEVRSTLDSEPPLNALFKMSSESLKDFGEVTKRLDTNQEPNTAKTLVSTVWRLGKNADGNLMVFEAVATKEPFYLLASYRLTESSRYEAERKLLRSLFDVLSLDAAPSP
jgi:hypothetical protein